MLVDENQHVVWKANYDEFGKATIQVEEVEFNQRFSGQYYDKETGLNYNYYRDYDPTTGRYVQSDPRGILLDFSDPQRQLATQMGVAIPSFKSLGYFNYLYGYVDQNPLSNVDKYGERILAVRVELSNQWLIYHLPNRDCDLPSDPNNGLEYIGVYSISNIPCNFLCYMTDSEWNNALNNIGEGFF